MTYRLNILLKEDVWQNLAEVPKGTRSQVINQALMVWFQKQKRKMAVDRMAALREKLPPVSTKKIVSWLKEERKRLE